MNSVTRPTWWRRGCLAAGRWFLRLGGKAEVTELHVNVPPGQQVTVETSHAEGGGCRLNVLIEQVDEALAQRVAQGGGRLVQALARRYGPDLRMEGDATAARAKLDRAAKDLAALKASRKAARPAASDDITAFWDFWRGKVAHVHAQAFDAPPMDYELAVALKRCLRRVLARGLGLAAFQRWATAIIEQHRALTPLERVVADVKRSERHIKAVYAWSRRSRE
jgi:hypothetical protein